MIRTQASPVQHKLAAGSPASSDAYIADSRCQPDIQRMGACAADASLRVSRLGARRKAVEGTIRAEGTAISGGGSARAARGKGLALRILVPVAQIFAAGPFHRRAGPGPTRPAFQLPVGGSVPVGAEGMLLAGPRALAACTTPTEHRSPRGVGSAAQPPLAPSVAR